jgi:ABC-type dipeptide/oligopeptide/nickel transport system permease component
VAKYILKRVGSSLLTLFLILTLVFCLLRLMPEEGYFNNYDKMSPTKIKVGREMLGLNSPLYLQLGRFYKQIVKLDLGVSSRYRVNTPINKIIAPKMLLSLKMGLLGVAISLAVGLPLGVLMSKSSRGRSRLKLWDKLGGAFVVIIQAVPMAVYCLFIQIFGTELLNRFFRLPMLFTRENWLTWLLPVFSYALGGISTYAMWTRRYMNDESNKDYVTLARAKGVPPRKISGHIFRNAVVPLIQYIPTTVAVTLMGSLYVESRYSIPGMGGLLVDVIKKQDNPMVQALVLIYSALSVGAVLVGDILMVLADPRISLGKKGDVR